MNTLLPGTKLFGLTGRTGLVTGGSKHDKTQFAMQSKVKWALTICAKSMAKAA